MNMAASITTRFIHDQATLCYMLLVYFEPFVLLFREVVDKYNRRYGILLDAER